MLPIFNNYINFLKNKTDKLDFLTEGYYWYDKSIIKAFDMTGNIVKVARVQFDDKLNVEVKLYDNNMMFLENWQETVQRNSSRLIELESKSIDLIKDNVVKHNNRKFAVLTSGGKDSSIVLHLVRKSNIEHEVIFNNTSLDCADTYLHIKRIANVVIINPEEGFYQWRERLNFIPTRFARACCSIFKEGAMTDYLDKDSKYLFFMGMRNQESARRSTYVDEWRNDKWGKREWDAILPIREWSELDVWLYILKEGMEFNDKYKKGYSRVGCAIACPFYQKSTWALDKYWYPKGFKRWQDILIEDFRSNNKDLIMNCTEEEYLTCWNGGVFREKPTDEVVEQFAKRNNLEVDVAKNYFNHRCSECDKRIKSKEVLGMNMKFNGRQVNRMYCKKHLIEKLNISKTEWNDIVQMFKQQGCDLF